MFLTLYHFSVLDGTFAVWDTRFYEDLSGETLVVEGEPDGWDNWDMGHSFLCMGTSRWWEVNLVDWDNWDMGHSICEETLVFGRRT